MKRLLAVSLTLVMVFGLVAVGSAVEVERVDVGQLSEVREIHSGPPVNRDYCNIWMDEAASGWISAWTFTTPLEVDFAVKKYIDPFWPLDPLRPEMRISDCILDEPFWPFHVTSFHIYLGTFGFEDGLTDVTIRWNLEYPEFGPDPGGSTCGFYPGAEIWSSDNLTYSLEDSSFYHLHLTLDTTMVPPENLVMDEPFIVSMHIVDMNPPGNWGVVTDTCAGNFEVECWNWWHIPWYAPGLWLEGFTYIGLTNLILWVDGFPEWQVPVEMGIFEAIPSDGMVRLNWQSMSETNNAYWIVSRDGEQLAQIEGQGSKESPTDYQYVDRNVVSGETYSYTLEAIDYEGTGVTYGPVVATAVTVPLNYALSQNYPNPFNASTVIRYDLAAGEHVTLKIFNINGQEVASLVDEYQKAGHYSVTWSGKGISSGVYMYTLTAGDYSETRKMVYTK